MRRTELLDRIDYAIRVCDEQIDDEVDSYAELFGGIKSTLEDARKALSKGQKERRFKVSFPKGPKMLVKAKTPHKAIVEAVRRKVMAEQSKS